jgi:Lysine methyltransferase
MKAKSVSEKSKNNNNGNTQVRRSNDSNRGSVAAKFTCHGNSRTDPTNGVRSPNITKETNHRPETVVAAAAKNIIIPNAITPVRIEWFTSKTTTASTATGASKKNDTNRITSVPQNVTNKNVSSSSTTFRAATTASGSILIHQSNQEETWPGGAIWDISWCMAQLIIGMIHDASSSVATLSSSTTTKRPGSSSSATTTTTTTTFYNDISIMTNPSSLVKPQELSQYIQNTIHIPSRLFEMLQNKNQEPSVMALTTLLGNHHIKQQHKHHLSKQTKSVNNRSSNRNDKTNNESIIVLELGCGTGLTGIVMAAAASLASTTCTVILTDLDVVIQNVTLPNVQRNIKSIKHNVMKTMFPLCQNDFPSKTETNIVNEGTATADTAPKQQLPLNIYTIKNNNSSSSGNGGCLIATPLCWGDHDDMNVVQSMIRYLQSPQPQQNNNTSINITHDSATTHDTENNDGCYACSSNNDGIPHILIIGDVAYQHKPGAISHFDILLETILHFTKGDRTLIIFGLRIRMNASMDLYEMLLQYFVDIIEPIVPNEIDPERFPMNHSSHKKTMNTMTIHFMKRKQNDIDTTNE